jgi:hypothetical protein
MKEPWCLAASTTTDTAKQLMTAYGKRWGIESGARLNNSWVKMTACSPQVRFCGKSGWIFEQRNQLI